MLVRNDVVRVVCTRSGESEVADGFAFQKLAGQRTVFAVRIAGRELHNRVNIGFGQLPLLAKAIGEGGFRIKFQLVTTKAIDRVLRHVVANRIKQPRRNRFRARRHFQIAHRIELQQVNIAARILDLEARRDAVGLAFDDGERARSRAVRFIRATFDFGNTHLPHAIAIGVPRRIRHFVQRVDVVRFNGFAPEARSFRERLNESVVGKIPEVAGFVSCWLRNGLHIEVQPDRLLFGI